MFTTKKEALKVIGSLSDPSKMPGYGWGISPSTCGTGSILYKKENSVCSNCYARHGHYLFRNVKECHDKRLELYKSNGTDWVNAMIYLLKDELYFRWFDSGDIYDLKMLEKIVYIAYNTPKTKHFFPTKQCDIVYKYLIKHNNFPDNLPVKISSEYINKMPIAKLENCGIITVGENKMLNKHIHNCPVTFNENLKTCKEANCYKCFEKTNHVHFKLHS